MKSFDVESLEWGYTRAFRAVRAHNPKREEGAEPGKWISFLPATMPANRREEVFDALAGEILSDPVLKGRVYQGKIALSPLAIAPNRIALMFYCLEDNKDDVLPVLQKLARRHRGPLLRLGELRPRDGFLGGWTFKSDAQTRQEMKQGTHDAQVSLLMDLFSLGSASPSRKLPRP